MHTFWEIVPWKLELEIKIKLLIIWLKIARKIVFADSEDAMEEDVQILEPNDINPCDWLLNRLPRLPIFANYYPQISNTLRFACQAENDPVVSIANRLSI